VINRLPRQPTLLMSIVVSKLPTATNIVDDSAYFSVSAPSWTRTTMVDGHKFLVALDYWYFVTGQKVKFLPTPPALGTFVGDDRI